MLFLTKLSTPLACSCSKWKISLSIVHVHESLFIVHEFAHALHLQSI